MAKRRFFGIVFFKKSTAEKNRLDAFGGKIFCLSVLCYSANSKDPEIKVVP